MSGSPIMQDGKLVGAVPHVLVNEPTTGNGIFLKKENVVAEKYNNEDYILHFSDDAGYGTMWDCAVITKENAEQFKDLSVREWGRFVTRTGNRISHLHPDTIGAAKKIV